jgi:hypothetical protein
MHRLGSRRALGARRLALTAVGLTVAAVAFGALLVLVPPPSASAHPTRWEWKRDYAERRARQRFPADGVVGCVGEGPGRRGFYRHFRCYDGSDNLFRMHVVGPRAFRVQFLN